MRRLCFKNILLVAFCIFLLVSTMAVPASAADQDTIDGCFEDNLEAVAQYYGYTSGSTANGGNVVFTCSKSQGDDLGYKEIYAQYKDGEGKVKQMIVATNAKLDTSDISMDIDNAQLKITGIMHNDEDAWNAIYSSMQKVIVGVTGVGILICLLAFVLQFIRLGASAGNPMEREKVLKGIIWTGIGTAGCGAATLIFGLAFGMI